MKKALGPFNFGSITRFFTNLPPQTRPLYLVLAFGGFLVLLYLIYSLLFVGQIYPNAYIGSHKFGGLNKTEAAEKLSKILQTNEVKSLTLVNDAKSYPLTTQDISYQPNVEKTVSSLYGIGRTGNFGERLLIQIKAPFSRQKAVLVADYDKEALNRKVAEVAEIIDQRAVDASASFVKGSLVLKKEQVGKRINRDEVTQQILERWGSFQSGEVTIQTYFESPKVVVADEETLTQAAEQLAAKKLTVVWEGGKKVLTKSQVASMVIFVGEAVEQPITDEGDQQQVLVARYDREAVKKVVEELSQEINQPAVDPKLIIRDGKVHITEVSRIGKVVDLDPSVTALYQSLASAEAVAEVSLALKVQEPVVNENNLDQLGIKEIIGRGETNFTGSPVNRRHNIKTGLSFLQSALLKPGEEFSTVKKLGAVDDTTGYLPELVIKENKTTPEYGGGLCQVSTTLFRSVLNAGLKVTERQNHSYRVSYYEPPVGLDATIYLPKPDLRFINDTPGHILVQGQIIGNKIVFELWGTSDGRTSNVTEPVISNIIPAPPEVRTETDTLPKGEVKQIEKPHEGATTIAYYTVTRNGEVINKQTFKSVYKPWAARFLVGTREDAPPAP